MLLFVKLVLGSVYFCAVNIGNSQTGADASGDSKHVCKKEDYSYDKNGYPVTGKGMELSVIFLRINNTWKTTVSWDRPTPKKNQTKCTGYHAHWYRAVVIGTNGYCKIIKNENIMHFIVDYTNEMEKYGKLGIAVFPLPRKSENAHFQMRWFTIPTLATPTSSNNTSQTNSVTTAPTSSNNTSQTNSVTTERTRRNPTQTNSSTRDKKNIGGAKRSTMSTLVVAIVVVGAGVVTVTISFLIFWIYQRKNRNPPVFFENVCSIAEENHNKSMGTHYISYYSNTKKETETAIRIASWLTQQGLNVTIDKFDVITNAKRKWCDRHISLAKKIILIISPGYLKFSKLDENAESDKEKPFSYKDQLAYNEICHIRDEVTKKPLATQRYVVILVETDLSELPYWMKRLNIFKYSAGILDKDILQAIKM